MALGGDLESPLNPTAPTPSRLPTKLQTKANDTKRRLTIAIILCFTFMLVELVAGYISHSLAILTDAAHMLSDLSSFTVSIFAIYLSTLPGTLHMSFGYHRAEILGALVSILVIWAMTFWLFAEAINRLIEPRPVNPRIMVYTALFGIATNLVLAVVLSHDHHHGHHHGHSHSHSHQHHSHHTHSAVSTTIRQLGSLPPAGVLPHETAAAGSSPAAIAVESGPPMPSNASAASPSQSSDASAFTPPAGHAAEAYRATASLIKDLTLLSAESVKRTGCMRVSESRADVYVEVGEQSPQLLPEAGAVAAEESQPDTHHHTSSKANINLSAAYIHALGDLTQNVGVLLAGLVILWKPHWTAADPICTLLFSVIVFMTTIGILKDATNVLMEGTPLGVDPAAIIADLLSLEAVTQVHDVHVWSLSLGKPALACHIVVDDPREAKRVLDQATALVQNKHRILHTTIQIDFSCNKSACVTDAHGKCQQSD